MPRHHKNKPKPGRCKTCGHAESQHWGGQTDSPPRRVCMYAHRQGEYACECNEYVKKNDMADILDKVRHNGE